MRPKTHDEIRAMSPAERSAYIKAVVAYTQQEPERWTKEAYWKARMELLENTGEAKQVSVVDNKAKSLDRDQKAV
jgi:hypothetical protein